MRISMIIIFSLFVYSRKVSKFFRSKSERKDSILTVIQCFGGGILLGTSLIILLPEVNKVIMYKSHREPFLWNRIWYLGWFGAGWQYLVQSLGPVSWSGLWVRSLGPVSGSGLWVQSLSLWSSLWIQSLGPVSQNGSVVDFQSFA